MNNENTNNRLLHTRTLNYSLLRNSCLDPDYKLDHNAAPKRAFQAISHSDYGPGST